MSKRTSARVLDVFTCCPPGPPLAENRQSSSSIRTTQVGVTRRKAGPPARSSSITPKLSGPVGAQLLDQPVDDVLQRRAGLHPAALAEITRPVIEDLQRIQQLPFAPRPPGHRRELLDELFDRRPHGVEAPPLVDDQFGVDAVAGGPPLVLP